MSKYPNWSEEELKLLREKYPLLGRNKEILQYFPGRPLEGICLKANRLGLRVINNIRERRDSEKYLEAINANNFYALEEYRGSTVPIKHMCGTCEYEWLARPQQLLRPSAKCPICSRESRLVPISTVDKTLAKVNLTRLSEYTGSLDTLRVKHSSCGYEWETVYAYIQQGSGCPKCNKGYSKYYENFPDKATLYVIKIECKQETFIKLGITCRRVNRRIKEIISSIGAENVTSTEILHIYEDSGKAVLNIEQNILEKFKSLAYSSKIHFAGSSELFPVEAKEALINYIKSKEQS